MSTSSRSVSSESVNAPSVVASPSSQPMSSDKASDQVPVQVFEGHERWVSCVCFYPDESKLVSGSRDGTLRVWDRKTGTVEVLKGYTNTVMDVDVSRDGKLVVGGGSDETVRIWNGESGETMHVFEGHENNVMSVEFSRDSTRVVSASDDGTVRVWSVEMGELAFEPIECHFWVNCARYSPSGDRIASGGRSIQIWNTETGSGIPSIRKSSVSSLVWTADGTHLIGVGQGNITIWNSHNGERLRTWKAHDNTTPISTLSLSPTGTHLASSNWGEKLAFVWDISTGEQVAAFKHSQNSTRIAYSPSGKFIATGCMDKKVYVWEAPMFKDPRTKAQKSRPPSFSWFLDVCIQISVITLPQSLTSVQQRPAITLAGPPRNNETGVDGFGHSLPNMRQASPSPRRIFNKVKSTFTNLFTRRSAGGTQTSPVREPIEPVEVAAGRDRVFWIIILPIVWTPVKRLVYMLFFCRKPEEEDEDLPANTATNSSQAAAGNEATSKQSDRLDTVDGAADAVTGPHSPPVPASILAVCSQPDRTAATSLSSTEGRGAPDSSPTESVNMVARGRCSSIPLTIPTPTHSTDPLFPVVTPYEVSPSAVAVTSARLSVSSNGVHSSSMQPSSQHMELQSAITLSPEEMALVQEYRRLKDTSVAVRVVAEPVSGPARSRVLSSP
ncbi:WD40 repeat-like protein [Paxillus ammoniavirescens]|nr:WD40 repeat-like protein [Paxillus ammoniavirescens]